MNSETRPIKIDLFSAETSAVIDFYVERTGRVSLVLCWTLSIGWYNLVPSFTHIHFTLLGEYDYMESKSLILISPSLSTIAYVCFSYINSYAFGYWTPAVVKGRDNIVYYLLIRKAIHVLKTIFPLGWVFSSTASILVLCRTIDKPGILLTVLNFIITIPFFYYFFQSLRYMNYGNED